MITLVVGASGATGRLLVQQLLNEGLQVRIILRSLKDFPEALMQNSRLTITQASLLDMSREQLLDHVQGCHGVVSCLGHNITVKGIFFPPRRLVTDGVRRLCDAIEKTAAKQPVKFILMNSTGNKNALAGETVSVAQSIVIGLIRHLVAPHADNEEAAAYLQSNYGTNNRAIEWAAVRPDSLVDEPLVTAYEVYQSPIRSAIFDTGKSSRINVANFMSQLIINPSLWDKWKNQMPVLYNADFTDVKNKT